MKHSWFESFIIFIILLSSGALVKDALGEETGQLGALPPGVAVGKGSKGRVFTAGALLSRVSHSV